jgi:hypothetical protein
MSLAVQTRRVATTGSTPAVTPRVVPHERALRALGYAPRVAARLAADRPDLAARIARGRIKPITLYRGLRLPPEQFDPRYPIAGGDHVFDKKLKVWTRHIYFAAASHKHETRLYMSNDTGVSTLLEVQMPADLVTPNGMDGSGHVKYLTVNQSRVPDLSPFIVRGARMQAPKYPDYSWPKTIAWADPEALFPALAR